MELRVSESPTHKSLLPERKKPRTAAGRRDMKTRNAGEEGMNEE